jgi:hypothetical protein
MHIFEKLRNIREFNSSKKRPLFAVMQFLILMGAKFKSRNVGKNQQKYPENIWLKQLKKE